MGLWDYLISSSKKPSFTQCVIFILNFSFYIFHSYISKNLLEEIISNTEQKFQKSYRGALRNNLEKYLQKPKLFFFIIGRIKQSQKVQQSSFKHFYRKHQSNVFNLKKKNKMESCQASTTPLITLISFGRLHSLNSSVNVLFQRKKRNPVN